jgi:hypothetical protein
MPMFYDPSWYRTLVGCLVSEIESRNEASSYLTLIHWFIYFFVRSSVAFLASYGSCLTKMKRGYVYSSETSRESNYHQRSEAESARCYENCTEWHFSVQHVSILHEDKHLILRVADHSGRAVWGMNCLLSLKRRDRGFESHSRHGYLCVYICVYVVLCIGRDLATGWSLVQGVVPSVWVEKKKITKLKKRPGPNKRL